MSDNIDINAMDSTAVPVTDSTTTAKNKRKLDETDQPAETVEGIKTRHKKAVKVPNIALELAKNRTTSAPGSKPLSSIPLSSLLSGDDSAHVSTAEAKQGIFTPSNSRLKVCSLLSSDQNANSETHHSPKIILPTQTSTPSTPGMESPGMMVARTISPVSSSPLSQNSGAKLNRSNSALNPTGSTTGSHLATKTSSVPVMIDLSEQPAHAKSKIKGAPTEAASERDTAKNTENLDTSSEVQDIQQQILKTEGGKTSAPVTKTPQEAINTATKKVVRRKKAKPIESKTEPEPTNVIIEDMTKASEPIASVLNPAPIAPTKEATTAKNSPERETVGPAKITDSPVAKKTTKNSTNKKTSKTTATKATAESKALAKTNENGKEKKAAGSAGSQSGTKDDSKASTAKKGAKLAATKQSPKVALPAMVGKETGDKEELKSISSKVDNAPANAKQPSKALEASKDKSGLTVPKDTKKKESKGTAKDDTKKETKTKRTSNGSKKKENTPQPPKGVSDSKEVSTPKRLLSAPPIKSPSLLEALDKNQITDEREEPVILVDVPLYPAESNDYLDENGQVVFNFYKLVQDKFGQPTKTKRNLISEFQGGDDDDEDGAEVEDDDGIEEEDDEDVDLEEKNSNPNATNASPKKKSHPMKGKSLIGKYDTEDPFIDDSELLWEEQRVATKDGFFVYFGPLIERGQYASFERVNGTMKRGGIKYSK
ncbi:Hpc2p LALA0_S07e00540g [Lachancea lanzarotensis]|uniref:LALA0S07e00540g1_1 n=1 Tax=Lachancea lanzarotensis TaxID=1245769 RepID=A0A0C7N500_9SACH|nr:uncharacterized protein LALA0_S07e00540g [Lachancea lanzarotensis]CEP63018.1 LALA0S07e00540g1_1 [Lachancea lanzarotensis]